MNSSHLFSSFFLTFPRAANPPWHGHPIRIRLSESPGWGLSSLWNSQLPEGGEDDLLSLHTLALALTIMPSKWERDNKLNWLLPVGASSTHCSADGSSTAFSRGGGFLPTSWPLTLMKAKLHFHLSPSPRLSHPPMNINSQKYACQRCMSLWFATLCNHLQNSRKFEI